MAPVTRSRSTPRRSRRLQRKAFLPKSNRAVPPLPPPRKAKNARSRTRGKNTKATAPKKTRPSPRKKKSSESAPSPAFTRAPLTTKVAENLPFEILEMILESVDIQTVLVSAQRVSKTWFQVISNSRPLQRKLFFAPASITEERAEMNPLLLKKFRLMLPRRPSWPVCMFSRQNVQDFVTNNQILFSEPRASWRRMVTQQPPILIITGSITRRVHGHHEARGRSHTCDDGVRMGLFFDLVTSSFGKKQSPFDFMIQWIHEDSMPWNVIWTIELHALLRAAGPVGYIWFSCNELSPNGSNGRYLLDDTVRYWWPFGL